MNVIPGGEFNEEVLDDLAPLALEREKNLIGGGFDKSEIDGTIPEYNQRPVDVDLMRKEFKASVKRLGN